MWNKATLALALVLVLGFTGTSFAYIDPGTGMSFVSGIGAFIAGFLALAFGAVAVTFKKWSAWIKGLFSKSKGGGDHPR